VFDAGLADDERFIAQLFDAVEQQAGLDHPNIAEVYDWDSDEGPFVVSELCSGGSLASLIARGTLLDPSQALVVALDVARGLNHGHEQGTIHRGLTPHNVAFGADGRVRITDFGLAPVRNGVSTAQSNRALENVRYASPEQARGRTITEATDLYSLALVINEVVTGVGPSVAETVVGTLMERAEHAALPDPTLGELQGPLERCGRVEASHRPEADELAIALLSAAEGMARPDLLPLAGIDEPLVSDEHLIVAGGLGDDDEPDEDVVPFDDFGDDHDGGERIDDEAIVESHLSVVQPAPLTTVEDITPDGDAEGSSAGAPDPGDASPENDIYRALLDDDDDEFDVSALGGLDDIEAFGADQEVAEPALSVVPNPSAEVGAGIDETAPAPQLAKESATLDVPRPSPSVRSARAAYDEVHDDATDRLPWWPLVLLVLLIAGAIAATYFLLGVGRTDDSRAAPNLIGLDIEDAIDAVTADVTVKRLEVRESGSIAGTIVSQSPAPNEELEAGDTLTVTISLGEEMVELPSDIVGVTLEQATARLVSVGLNLGEVTEEHSETLETGLVLGLDEPTTQKPAGQPVSLRISAGPEDRVVPNGILGVDVADAFSTLVASRLQPVEEKVFDPEQPVGMVLAADPRPGEIVPADSAVKLTVSAGPEPVEIPDITGLGFGEAREIITELGLVYLDVEGTPGQDVIGAEPPIGSVVDVGTEVTIILAEEDPDEDEEDAEG